MVSERYFNPRTPCGVRHSVFFVISLAIRISIHAPLAGCDEKDPVTGRKVSVFQSTHPLRGATSLRFSCGSVPRLFQSTHPLRGATPPKRRRNVQQPISIHAPLAGCDACARRGNPVVLCISIHAPLAGCDVTVTACDSATVISIHAPLAGCDVWLCSSRCIYPHFNPRTPCGVRQCLRILRSHGLRFQSTHPLRGATAKTYKENCTFFELADKLSARIAAKKPSAKADRCA